MGLICANGKRDSGRNLPVLNFASLCTDVPPLRKKIGRRAIKGGGRPTRLLPHAKMLGDVCTHARILLTSCPTVNRPVSWRLRHALCGETPDKALRPSAWQAEWNATSDFYLTYDQAFSFSGERKNQWTGKERMSEEGTPDRRLIFSVCKEAPRFQIVDVESVIACARLSVSVNKPKKRPRSEKTAQAAKIRASEKRRFFHFSTIRFPHYLEAWKRLSQWLSISQSIKDFISLRNLWIAKSFG